MLSSTLYSVIAQFVWKLQSWTGVVWMLKNDTNYNSESLIDAWILFRDCKAAVKAHDGTIAARNQQEQFIKVH